MAEESQTPPKRRNLQPAIYGTLILAAFIAGAWYLTSDSFREVIRHRLIATLEDATGGQVEIGAIGWNLTHLRVRVESLTIHGLEAPTDSPLLHVNRIDARLRIISLLERRVSFRSLSFDHPAVNLIIYPDGRTNQPTPRVHSTGGKGPVDPIFDVAIRYLEVKGGVLQVNEQKTPVDWKANDVFVSLGYQRNPEFYAGKIGIGKFDTHLRDCRPFSSTVNIDFQLYRNSIEIRSAQIHSERSEVSFTGELKDFSKPEVTLNYQATVDLRQLGSIFRAVALQAGSLELNGRARYSAEQMVSTGKLQLSNGAWMQEAVHAGSINGTAQFHVDQDRLEISKIAATALGGNVTGQFLVTHWNVPPREHPESVQSTQSRGYTIAAREQSAKATFELRGLQVDKIAAAFSTRHMPFDQLRPMGSANGQAELTWAGSPKAAELKLDVRATPVATGSQMPVSATLQGIYSFRALNMRIAQAEVETPNSHLSATGLLGANSLDLEVGATTQNIHEIDPLLAANGLRELPVELAGEGSFHGSIAGHPAMPVIAGHLKLRDFVTVIQPREPGVSEPALVKALHKRGRPSTGQLQQTAASKPVRFHWDSFDGYIGYGPTAASVRGGVLLSGSARFEVSASTTLQNGLFTDASVFHATSRIHDAKVEDVQALIGVGYPVTGTLNANLEMNGTRPEPVGSGRLAITGGTAYGEPLQSFATDLAFSGREVRFSDVRAVSGDAKAHGSGSFNVSTEEFHLDVQGSGVDLLRFPVLQTSKVKLTGIASFEAKGHGTLSAPALDGKVHIGNISLGGKREGDLEIDAITRGEDMNLTATSHFVTAKLSASGRIRLRGDLDSDITAKFENVDLQPFLIGIARGHSSIDGNVHATGPLRYPLQMNARLEIPRYESQVETVVLRNSGNIVASYRDGTATLESFRLVGDETDLTSTGTAHLTGGKELRMRADGQLNLKLLQSFNSEIISYGRTVIGVRVGGTLGDPALRGRITIDHAGVSYVDLPNGLSDLNGTLVFNENRLQVEKLTAHTGGGDLAIGGFITYGRNVSFNLTATGKDIRIRYPEGVSANGDADLRLAGTLQNATLSGEVIVNKFGLNPRFDFAYYLTRSKQLPVTPNPDSPLNNLHFDVRVVSTPELQVQTSLAKITGDVDLRLRGNALRPIVLGRISIVEGDITFNGTKYRLDRGDILFTNPTKIEPVLDLEASARVSDYDISIGLHGTTEKLNTTYRSDPPLPTADVFALLAFGRTTDQAYTAPQSNAYTESASSAVLGSALNAAVSSRVQKLFGASRIKIDPQVGGAENNPNARITVEQQVSGNITLTYITNLAQSAQQVIQFQYNVNRNISIVGVRDEYGVVGFEVQIRQRRR
jgi:translocation and assembly module TamB